ncbi:MAG: GNAT family N-acetyltransferase [Chloroflexi bacterium]|nr:GNAT family N-acetyltransferase [Chloroflexota bacterium]
MTSCWPRAASTTSCICASSVATSTLPKRPPRKAVDVPSITSERLELVSMSTEFMRACVEGNLAHAADLIGATLPASWPGAAVRTMRRRLRQLAADPTEQPWLLRAMLTRTSPTTLVGRVGFHAPPDARGAVEVGYAVEPEYRRQGFASEAVEALLDWAAREHGISWFVASVGPNNLPSLALVKRVGFIRTGTRWDDEDGEELVFELHR